MKSYGLITAAALAASLASAPSFAVVDDERETRQLEMISDLLIARPFGLVLTTLGAAAFIVSLPITAASGTIEEAAQTLVVEPAEETFVRCLGCTVVEGSSHSAD